MTVSNHGDPSSALLEVLDPEQNTTFHDNYIDMEYDLSKVLFIATANNVANIAPALRDRMEMINIPGYLVEEKIRIALDHLLPKQREAHGIKEQELVMTPPKSSRASSPATPASRAFARSTSCWPRSPAPAPSRSLSTKPSRPKSRPRTSRRFSACPSSSVREYEVGGMTGVVTALRGPRSAATSSTSNRC